MPALIGEHADGLGEDRAADVVHHQVHPLAVGRFHYRVMEVGLARRDADVEAVALERLQLGARARRTDDPGAHRLRRGERRHADAGRDAGNEQPFVRLQAALLDQHVVNHQESDRHGGRLLPGELLWHRDGVGLVHEGVLTERPRKPPHDALAAADDFTGSVGAGSLGGARLSEAVAADEFPTVEARRAHVHEQFCRRGLGLRAPRATRGWCRARWSGRSTLSWAGIMPITGVTSARYIWSSFISGADMKRLLSMLVVAA